jgi:hypothetical protein
LVRNADNEKAAPYQKVKIETAGYR